MRLELLHNKNGDKGLFRNIINNYFHDKPIVEKEVNIYEKDLDCFIKKTDSEVSSDCFGIYFHHNIYYFINNLLVGSGNHNSINVYVPTRQDFDYSKYRNQTSFEEWRHRILVNVLGHELREYLLKPSKEMIDNYYEKNIQKQQELMSVINNDGIREKALGIIKKCLKNNLENGNVTKHFVLLYNHEPGSDCAGALDYDTNDLPTILDYVYEKNGLCNECMNGLEKNIKDF